MREGTGWCSRGLDRESDQDRWEHQFLSVVYTELLIETDSGETKENNSN